MGWKVRRAAITPKPLPTLLARAVGLMPSRISVAAAVSSTWARVPTIPATLKKSAGCCSVCAAARSGPVLAVGVSLGGNALMRWAGEMGDAARGVACAVASVCSPIDLAAGGRAIGQGFNRLVYTRMFLRTMVPKALQKLQQHPGLFDRDRLLRARDLYEFDNIFTAPLHGFRDTDDYWARASAKPHLHRIRVPALVVNALNDPFVPAQSLPAAHEVGAHVTLWQPAQGGHVGFPQGRLPGHVLAMPEAVGTWLAQAGAGAPGVTGA
jgi:predicted alpha/beta-fold hydrolase